MHIEINTDSAFVYSQTTQFCRKHFFSRAWPWSEIFYDLDYVPTAHKQYNGFRNESSQSHGKNIVGC